MLPSYLALPNHLAPGLLVFFMIALAMLPLAIIWLDERRSDSAASRLAKLREAVKLREQLARIILAEKGRTPEVVLPGA